MNREQIEVNVIRIMADQLMAERSTIQLDARLIDDLNADSLDALELVMEFEHVFGVSIDDDDAARVRTVRDVVDRIEQLIAAKGVPHV